MYTRVPLINDKRFKFDIKKANKEYLFVTSSDCKQCFRRKKCETKVRISGLFDILYFNFHKVYNSHFSNTTFDAIPANPRALIEKTPIRTFSTIFFWYVPTIKIFVCIDERHFQLNHRVYSTDYRRKEMPIGLLRNQFLDLHIT
jgi:hypothetical protein